MDFATVMSSLRAKGKPNTVKTYRHHGVAGESFGVSYADLGALVKKLKVDHELALGLWKTGVHEARVLAAKVADPARMARSDIEAWLADADNYVITDALSGLAARMPEAPALARAWIGNDGEHQSAAGWNVFCILAMEGKLQEDEAGKLIGIIQKRISGSKNRTRHSMNNALISIGGSMPALHRPALEAARAIGRVHVDHGETGCRTPDAAAYIEKMAARAATRTRVTGPRMKASPGAERPGRGRSRARRSRAR